MGLKAKNTEIFGVNTPLTSDQAADSSPAVGSASVQSNQHEKLDSSDVKVSTPEMPQLEEHEQPPGNADSHTTPTELVTMSPPFTFPPKSGFRWPSEMKTKEVRANDLYMVDRILVKNKGKFEVGSMVVDDSVSPPSVAALVAIAVHTHGPKVEFWTTRDKVTLKTLRVSHLSLASADYEGQTFEELAGSETIALVQRKVDTLKARQPYARRTHNTLHDTIVLPHSLRTDEERRQVQHYSPPLETQDKKTKKEKTTRKRTQSQCNPEDNNAVLSKEQIEQVEQVVSSALKKSLQRDDTTVQPSNQWLHSAAPAHAPLQPEQFLDASRRPREEGKQVTFQLIALEANISL